MKIDITWKKTGKLLFVIFLLFMIYQYFDSDFLKEQTKNTIISQMEAITQEGLTGFERFALSLNILWGSIGFYFIPIYIFFMFIDLISKKSKRQKELEVAERKIRLKYKILREEETLKKLKRKQSGKAH